MLQYWGTCPGSQSKRPQISNVERNGSIWLLFKKRFKMPNQSPLESFAGLTKAYICWHPRFFFFFLPLSLVSRVMNPQSSSVTFASCCNSPRDTFFMWLLERERRIFGYYLNFMWLVYKKDTDFYKLIFVYWSFSEITDYFWTFSDEILWPFTYKI